LAALLKLFALLRRPGLGQLALGLRRFLAGPAAVGTPAPTRRLAATFRALRKALFFAPFGLFLALFAVLDTGKPLLLASLFALVLRAHGLTLGGGARGWRSSSRRSEW
jgi:hypothetical protein